MSAFTQTALVGPNGIFFASFLCVRPQFRPRTALRVALVLLFFRTRADVFFLA